jgi:hypothetical protein
MVSENIRLGVPTRLEKQQEILSRYQVFQIDVWKQEIVSELRATATFLD